MLLYWKNKVIEAINGDVGKRVLSTILAVVMVFGLLPTCYAPEASAATALATAAGTRTTLTNGGSYTLAAGSYSNIIYTVAANATVTVTTSGTVTINDQSAGGSPFTLSSGSTLNLVVNGTLNVYGRIGGNGATASETATACANVGYAGIGVPSGSTLKISGSGTLNAYGGDAGDGGSGGSTYYTVAGGGGGAGAGAGIGGNGGLGGTSGKVTAHGSNGSAAGTVLVIGSSTKVNAYGGAGGSGGISSSIRSGAPGGGGGYPGAGIGGGGGGAGGGSAGRCENGNGGFSGGGGAGWNSNDTVSNAGGTNGNGGSSSYTSSSPNPGWSGAGGGGYFAKGGSGTNYTGGEIGGNGGGDGARGMHGGAGGAGGAVYYLNKNNVKAYNGSYVTTAASGASGNAWGTYATGIYAQMGYNIETMRSQGVTKATWNNSTKAYSFTGATPSATAVTKTSYGLGIGSGAGYTEGGNGTAAQVALPTAPTVTAAPNNTSGQVKIDWTTAANGGQPITKVEILRGTTVVATYSGSTLTSNMTTSGKANSYTDTSLTNGTSYSYTVRVTNIMGSVTSAAKTATPRAKPSAPTGVTAKANGANGQLVVGWTTAANNGSAITKVEVINTKASNKVLATTDTVTGTQKLTLSTAMTTSGQKPSVTLTGLTGGTTYGIAIRVTNAAGNTTSASVDGTPNGPPLQVASVTAAGTGVSGQIKMTWKTPANNGAVITAFRILDDKNSVVKEITQTSDPNLWGSNISPTKDANNTYYLTGRTNGTATVYKVAAVNSAGQGPAGTASTSATAYTNPGAPAITSITRGNKQLTVKLTS